jgi:hypothetical protein
LRSSIAKNLINLNKNINKNFSFINYGKFYQQNYSLLYLSVNTDGNNYRYIPREFAAEKEGIKKATKVR